MKLNDLKHAQRERLTYLDRCLLWRGAANRRDLIERFKLSEPQAANDFKAYLELNQISPPVYDPTRKTYVAARPHQPIAPCGVEDAIDILRGEEAGGVPSILPTPERVADPSTLSRLFQAIRARIAINIAYTSMTTGASADQWIAPTTFMSDGQTIYFRAFSFRHEEHRTYLPIRIAPDTGFTSRPLETPPPPDLDWRTKATVWLRPKRDLSEAQQAAIRLEYGFDGDCLKVETRKPLEFFLARRWGLDQPTARLELDRTEYEPIDPEETVIPT